MTPMLLLMGTQLEVANATPPGPNGDLVYSVLDRNSGDFQVLTMNPASSNPSSVRVWSGVATRDPASGGLGTSWSPSGMIAFAAHPNGHKGAPSRVHVVRPDGSGLRVLETGHGNNYDPAFSPDGSKIAFTAQVNGSVGPPSIVWEREGDIWTMNGDGNNSKNVTNTPGNRESGPDFAPDGSRIAFWESGSDGTNIYSIAPDGSNRQTIDDKTGTMRFDPVWSPDGTKLAFHAFKTDNDSNIYVYDKATGSVTEVTTGAQMEMSPTWSPDGTRLAFSSFVVGLGGASNDKIMIVDAAGGTPQELAPGHNPDWSPDGSTIAFHRLVDGDYELFVVPASGGTPSALTNNDAADYQPAWSPDGHQIAFVSDRDGNPEIYTVHAATGGGVTRMTNDPGNDADPRWGPPQRAPAADYIFVMNSDGSNIQRVTAPIVGGDPAWSPDGSRIAFTDRGDIFSIMPDGRGLAQMTRTPDVESQPSYSPDGIQLAFTKRSGTKMNIYTLHVPRGGGVTRLTAEGGAWDSSPVWSPAGDKIAFARQTNTSITLRLFNLDGSGEARLPYDLSHEVLDLDWGSSVGTPDTVITDGPGENVASAVTFQYSSSATEGSFKCRLSAHNNSTYGHDWEDCGSAPAASKTYSDLEMDTYDFYVKAVGPSGTEDPSPAHQRFTVVGVDESKPRLSVTKAGTGFGSVSSHPNKLSCDEDTASCSATFTGSVTLTAQAAADSQFLGWRGACWGTGLTCTVSMDADKLVEAKFALDIEAAPRCGKTFTVGNWSFEGCFDAIGSRFETSELFRWNGLTVYPAEEGKITIDTSARMLSATGAVGVAAGPAHVAGHKVGPFVLYRGDLNFSLGAPTITVQAPASVNLLGFPALPEVKLEAPAPGHVDLDLKVKLPDVLGGTPVDATLSAHKDTGLKVETLAIGPTDASLAGIAEIKNASFNYTEAGWSASAGTVITPGAQGSFTASFAYSGSTLTSAVVNVPEVTVAGFLDASNFKLTYDRGQGLWQASANVNGPNGPSVSGQFVYRNDVLQTAKLAGARVGIFGVITVNEFSFDYDKLLGWSAVGDVAGVVGGKFSATFRYKDSLLTTGNVSIGGLKVGDAFSLRSLALGYENKGTHERWFGNADVGSDGTKAVVDFTMADGGLRSGTIDVANLNLFEVVKVAKFHASYNSAVGGGGTKWTLSATASVPGSSAASLDASMTFRSDGSIRAGHFGLANASLAGALQVNDFFISYASDTASWAGRADIVLPGPMSAGFKVDVAFKDGLLTKGYGEYRGINWPVGGGVFVNSIGAGIETQPEWSVKGDLGISGGPTVTLPSVGELSAASIAGGMTLRLPSASSAGGFKITGKANIVNIPLADGYIDYWAPLSLEVAGCLADCANGWNIPNIGTVKASVVGKIRGLEAFQVKGSMDAKLSLCAYGACWKPSIAGQAILSNIGVAACGTIQADADSNFGTGWSAGAAYKWGGSPQAFAGCDLAEYESIPGAARLRAPTTGEFVAGRVTATATNVPAGLPVYAFRFEGENAPPHVTLTRPGGAKIETPSDPSKLGINGDHLIAQIGKTNETIVLVDNPEGGKWQVSLQPGSSAIASAKFSQGLPEAQVSGSVTGLGTQQMLTWESTAIEGQTITFSEEGGGTAAVIHETTDPSGTISFSPAAGEAGTRTIVAQVSQDGLPRDSFEITTYEAPQVNELTVTLAGKGTGSVVADEAGIDCGDDCTTVVGDGSIVTLTATAAPGSAFTGWSGLCGGMEVTCTVSPTTTAGVTAAFRPDTGPEIAGVDRRAVQVGDTVTIEGNALSDATGVRFGKVASEDMTVLSDEIVIATVPMGATTAPVRVTTPAGEAAAPVKLKVTPSIDDFKPRKAKRGSKVTVTGMSFAQVKKVKIGKTLVTRFKVVSYTQIKLRVPKKARKGKIKVITAGGKAVSPNVLNVRRRG